jgi:GNAT superfamily N-acetyltransferase
MTDPFALTEATWPAAAYHSVGPWLVREGRGGGQRVSSATAAGPWTEADIPLAEARLAALGQPAIFSIRPGDEALDAALAARGYARHDPVHIYHAPVADLAAKDPPPVTTFAVWPPLAIMVDLWAEGGIGPGRLAVMDRVTGPKTALLGRVRDRAAATAFVAIDGNGAMLHALHVAPAQRRQGLGVYMMRAAARWAQDHDAKQFFLLVTAENAAANALYTSLGMHIVGQYHYRLK